MTPPDPARKPKPTAPRPRARKAARARTSPSAPSHDDARLAPIRKGISELDQRLVELLNQRAALAVEVGRIKRDAGLPTYAPHREAQVLERVLGLSKGPMPARTLEAIYRELMSGSFTLQRAPRIAYLGPAGSYSHEAVSRHFGGGVDHHPCDAIASALSEVLRGNADSCVLPVENSTSGGVVETLDALRDQLHRAARRDVVVCAEVQLSIRHALLGASDLRSITRVHSKPEVFAQCRKWISQHLPGAQLVPASSSSAGAAQVARAIAGSRGKLVRDAAIGSEAAGRLHGLATIAPGIEDVPGNATRFLVLSTRLPEPTGDDKTSLVFDLADKAGALALVLSELAREGVNLTHIEKRPSGKRRWSYTFFVDALGHQRDPALARALVRIRSHCKDMLVLGSYPRSKRLL